MSKQYNTKLQERLEKFLKDDTLTPANEAPKHRIRKTELRN